MTGPINQQIPQNFVLNTPSKPVDQGAARGRSQKDRRYTDTFFDNHRHPRRFPNGRPWCGEREIAANTELLHEDGFCSPDLMRGEYVETDFGTCDRAATLMSAWNAPWTPLAKYFKFNYPKKRITFEYDRMLADERDGVRRYYRAASKLGIQLNIRVEPGVIPHPQIVNELGEPSRMVKVIEAAMSGDPWLLGFIDEPNPTLAEILGYNERGMPVYESYTPPVAQDEVVASVLAAPPNADLMELLKSLTATVAQLSAESQARKAKGEQMRAGKHKRQKGQQASQNLAEKPAA